MWQHFLLSLSTFYRNCALGFQPVKNASLDWNHYRSYPFRKMSPAAVRTGSLMGDIRLYHQATVFGPNSFGVGRIPTSSVRSGGTLCPKNPRRRWPTLFDGLHGEPWSQRMLFRIMFPSFSLLIPFKKWRVSISETSRFHYFPLFSTIPWAWCARHYRFKMICSQSLRLKSWTMKLPVESKLWSFRSSVVETSQNSDNNLQTCRDFMEFPWHFHGFHTGFVFLDPPKRIKKEPGGTWNRSSDPPWLLSQ